MTTTRRLGTLVVAAVLAVTGPLAVAPVADAATLPADTMFTVGGAAVSGTALTAVRVSATSLYLGGKTPVLASVVLTQPTDRPVAAGDVLVTSPTAAGPATPQLVVSGVTCDAPQPGRIAVDDATYDDAGVLTTLVARYAFACDPDASTPSVTGELRLSSTVPFALGRPAFSPSWSLVVPVGATTRVTAVVVNGGTAPMTPADVALSAAPEVGARVVTDGCTGVVLAPSGQCRIDLDVTPTQRLSRTQFTVVTTVPELPGPDADVRGGSVRGTFTLTSDSPPVAPTGVLPTAGVDGIALSWSPTGATSSSAAAATYDVHRSSPAGDRDFTGLKVAAVTDPALPAGTVATYTVRGVNAYGTGPWSDPVSATVPVWDGPYDPARRELSMAWDEAAGGQSFSIPSYLSSGPLFAVYASGRVSFGDLGSTSVSLPTALADGRHDVGTGAGAVDVRATLGRACTSPSGTVQVLHSAPSYNRAYASVSADGDLLCGDGHHLRFELRWSTPETVHTVSAGDLTSITAVWDRPVSRTMTVTNTGSAPATLGGVRLVDDAIGSAARFRITGSTCPNAVLQPQETCAVTVEYTPVTGAWANDYAVLVVRGDLGEVPVGEIAGLPVASLSSPRQVRATSRPGHVEVSWAAPTGTDGEGVGSYRVEELGVDDAVTVLASTDASTTSVPVGALAEGAHRVRVVVRTTAGHESASDAVTVTVPSRWLLTTDGHGLRAADPDGSGAGGGQIGTDADWLWAVTSSPTRQHVVVSAGYDSTHLELRDLEGVTVRSLTDGSAGDDVDPAVSPDATRVAFTRVATSGAHRLMVVPTAGGAAVEVPAATDLSAPSWTPDGRFVIASDDRDVTPVPGLVRVDVTTGARTPIAGTSGAWAVSVSRTGSVAYLLTDPTTGLDQLRTTSAAGGTSTLVGGAEWLDDVAWDPTGRFLAVTGRAPWASTGTTWVYDTTAPATAPQQMDGGWSLAWYAPHSAAPTVALTGADVTGRSATLTVAASDPDDAPGGLRRECRLDGGAWVTCGATWSLTGLVAGRHTATARATDPSGRRSAEVSRGWTVDATPPTTWLTSIGPLGTSSDLALRWSGYDAGGAGTASYDVRMRYASPSGSWSGYVYPSTWQGLRSASLSWRMSPGYEYCVSVRARDRAGNVGAWSAQRCTAAPLDDVSLTSSGWSRGRASYYLSGTYSLARRTGATLSRTAVRGRQIGVVVTTCATCGSLDVYHAGVRLGSLSLVSSRTTYRKVLWLPAGATRYGTVVLRTRSARTAIVDGIAVLH